MNWFVIKSDSRIEIDSNDLLLVTKWINDESVIHSNDDSEIDWRFSNIANCLMEASVIPDELPMNIQQKIRKDSK